MHLLLNGMSVAGMRLAKIQTYLNCEVQILCKAFWDDVPKSRTRCFIPIADNQNNTPVLRLFIFLSVLLGLVATTTAWADDDDEGGGVLTITSARWDDQDNRLTVRGDKDRTATVTVVTAANPAQVIGSDNDWRVRDRQLCRQLHCRRPGRRDRHA